MKGSRSSNTSAGTVSDWVCNSIVAAGGVYNARMPRLIAAPSVIQAAGNKPKRIEEFAGRVNSGHDAVSVARMTSPSGWEEPGQRPEFEEITVVLRGMVRVESEDGVLEVRAGQAVVTRPGEWVRYSTPEPDGAEYIAVCIPAFAPNTVHRDG
jgi:mannose-6-phosphate isomerase-like protein (cupin superfamily)